MGGSAGPARHSHAPRPPPPPLPPCLHPILQGKVVKGRVLVCADGSTSRLATQLGYCTAPPQVRQGRVRPQRTRAVQGCVAWCAAPPAARPARPRPDTGHAARAAPAAQGVSSRAYIEGGSHNANFDGLVFYPRWSLPGCALRAAARAAQAAAMAGGRRRSTTAQRGSHPHVPSAPIWCACSLAPAPALAYPTAAAAAAAPPSSPQLRRHLQACQGRAGLLLLPHPLRRQGRPDGQLHGAAAAAAAAPAPALRRPPRRLRMPSLPASCLPPSLHALPPKPHPRSPPHPHAPYAPHPGQADDLKRLHEDAIKHDPFISRAMGPNPKCERMRAGSLRVGGQGARAAGRGWAAGQGWAPGRPGGGCGGMLVGLCVRPPAGRPLPSPRAPTCTLPPLHRVPGLTTTYDDHLIIVGDAAGFIDPLTGAAWGRVAGRACAEASC